LKNGIEILGMGMDPGFHRGDDGGGRTKFFLALSSAGDFYQPQQSVHQLTLVYSV
jgi:hypothetical protein